MALIFVDVEAHFNSPCPNIGDGMTEFGVVEFESRLTYHGVPLVPVNDLNGVQSKWYYTFRDFELWLHQFKPPYIFVSDNPAYDWQWINYWFHKELGRNPFGWSARRIGDYAAGRCKNFWKSSKWKKLRITNHDHNPVNDALGNSEAFLRIENGEYDNEK